MCPRPLIRFTTLKTRQMTSRFFLPWWNWWVAVSTGNSHRLRSDWLTDRNRKGAGKKTNNHMMSIWQPACQASSATEKVIWSSIRWRWKNYTSHRGGLENALCNTPQETYLSPSQVNCICKLSRRQSASLRLVIRFLLKSSKCLSSHQSSLIAPPLEDKR